MAQAGRSADSVSLTPDEKQYYSECFRSADKEGLGVITGEVAVEFFKRSNLSANVLGEIWQLADTDNKGFLTQSTFVIALRLIAFAQQGHRPRLEFISRTGPPYPKFDGLNFEPKTIAMGKDDEAIPPLSVRDKERYVNMFQKLSPLNGILNGNQAREIFVRARLSNDALRDIWNLADRQQRGALDVQEFVIAMHLIQCIMTGSLKDLPKTLTPSFIATATVISPRSDFLEPFVQSGSSTGLRSNGAMRTTFNLTSHTTGESSKSGSSLRDNMYSGLWDIKPEDAANYFKLFREIDQNSRGYILGDEAVSFFLSSKLPESILAQIWDLADIDKSGKLNMYEFAVAMYLIRRKVAGYDLPSVLPESVIPPPLRQSIISSQSNEVTNAAAVERTANTAAELLNLSGSKCSDSSDHTGLQHTHSLPSVLAKTNAIDDPFNIPLSAQKSEATFTTSKPIKSPNTKPDFVPMSTFGQTLASKMPLKTHSPSPSSASLQMRELLNPSETEVSQKMTSEAAELGNLSNQVNSLSEATREIKQHKNNIEIELQIVTNQKGKIEERLMQLRALYDNEVKSVKQAEERLNDSKVQTQKLNHELNVLEASYSALCLQMQEKQVELEQEQAVIATIKNRTLTVIDEIERMKRILETTNKEGEQQKELLAVVQTQLNTAEAEKEKISSLLSQEPKENQAESFQEGFDDRDLYDWNDQSNTKLNFEKEDRNPFSKTQSTDSNLGRTSSSLSPFPAIVINDASENPNMFSISSKSTDEQNLISTADFKLPEKKMSQSFPDVDEKETFSRVISPVQTQREYVDNDSPVGRSTESVSESINSSVAVNMPQSSRASTQDIASLQWSDVANIERSSSLSETMDSNTPKITTAEPKALSEAEGSLSPDTNTSHHGPMANSPILSPQTVQETLSHPPRDFDLAISPPYSEVATSEDRGRTLRQEPYVIESSKKADPVSPGETSERQEQEDTEKLVNSKFPKLEITSLKRDRQFEDEFPPIKEYVPLDEESDVQDNESIAAGNLQKSQHVGKREDANPEESTRAPSMLSGSSSVSQYQEVLEFKPMPGSFEASSGAPALRIETSTQKDSQLEEQETVVEQTVSDSKSTLKTQPSESAYFNENDKVEFASSKAKSYDFEANFDDLEPAQVADKAFLEDDKLKNFENFDLDFTSNIKQNDSELLGSTPSSKQKMVDDFDAAFAVFDDPTADDNKRQVQLISDASKIVQEGEGEKDDPDLKSLLGMGFRRKDALKALEKYNYNLTEVCLDSN